VAAVALYNTGTFYGITVGITADITLNSPAAHRESSAVLCVYAARTNV